MNIDYRSVLNWLIARLKEPSTIIAIGFLLSFAHIPVPSTTLQIDADSIRYILMGVSGILGVVMPEGSAAQPSIPSVVPDRATAMGN